MYLLLSLVSRFVQTPTSAGYGFGASVLVAGLVLTPFSVLGFVAGRLLPAVARRTSSWVALAGGCGVVLVATVLFALARTLLWQVFVVMGVAGLGVGLALAAVPGLVVSGVPAHQTGAAMSFNQVLRTVGFSAGSALSAVILQAHTPPGSLLPRGDGYQVAAWVGAATLAATVVVSLVLARGSLRPPAGSARPG
jgi:MFS family permease